MSVKVKCYGGNFDPNQRPDYPDYGENQEQSQEQSQEPSQVPNQEENQEVGKMRMYDCLLHEAGSTLGNKLLWQEESTNDENAPESNDHLTQKLYSCYWDASNGNSYNKKPELGYDKFVRLMKRLVPYIRRVNQGVEDLSIKIRRVLEQGMKSNDPQYINKLKKSLGTLFNRALSTVHNKLKFEFWRLSMNYITEPLPPRSQTGNLSSVPRNNSKIQSDSDDEMPNEDPDDMAISVDEELDKLRNGQDINDIKQAFQKLIRVSEHQLRAASNARHIKKILMDFSKIYHNTIQPREKNAVKDKVKDDKDKVKDKKDEKSGEETTEETVEETVEETDKNESYPLNATDTDPQNKEETPTNSQFMHDELEGDASGPEKFDETQALLDKLSNLTQKVADAVPSR